MPILTSLRDSPQIFIDAPVEKKKDLVELQSVISDLEKKRTILLGEIERLNRDTSDVKKRLGTEIGTLNLQRKKLFSQINTLTSVLLKTQNHQESVIKGMEEFGNEHIQFLNSLSHSLQLDVKDITAKIAQRSEQLKGEEDLMAELSMYLTEYAQNNETDRAYNFKERLQNEKVARYTSSEQERIEKMSKKTKDYLQKTEDAYRIINDKKKTVEKLNSWLEEKATKEQNHLREWEKELKLQKIEILAERKEFINQKETLVKREKRILDKEQTLQRSYAEVKEKAKKIGIMI